MKINDTSLILMAACAILLPLPASRAQSQPETRTGPRMTINVTTAHYDNARTGQNNSELILNPLNVQSSFGLLAILPVDGQVYAEPLVLAGVVIKGRAHQVVYIATENDSLYAFDADSYYPLWKRSFINPAAGITTPTSDELSCGDIYPQYGISATPVIDTSVKPAVIYTNSYTYENGNFIYRLHKLSSVDGKDLPGSPVVVQDNDGIFDGMYENQRAGLLIEGNHLIFSFSSHCDINPWYGWVFSYNKNTLALENYWVPVNQANGGQAGIWMGEDGLAADSAGNLFLATGNGPFDGVSSFGDSIVKLPPPPLLPATWQVSDFYTPADQQLLNDYDADLGSGGVLLLPTLDEKSPNPHLLVQAGKEGKISIVNRDNMGQYCAPCINGADTNIVEEIPDTLPGGMYGSPTYWNGYIYMGGAGTSLNAYSYDRGTGYVSTSPVASTAHQFGWGPPTSPQSVVSSNHNGTAIVWALDAWSGALFAFDPRTLDVLYDGTNDSYYMNGGIKFLTPVVANGKVYVGSSYEVGVFGLYSK